MADEVVHNLGDTAGASRGDLRRSERHNVAGARCSLDGEPDGPGGSVRGEKVLDALRTQLEGIDLSL